VQRKYRLNITEKLEKLAHIIRLWKSRNLTFEGESLVIWLIKTNIYNLQAYKIQEECSKNIERKIYGFLWVIIKRKKDNGKNRIVTSIQKNYIVEEGLNITDIECFDKLLNLRQFVKSADQSN
jgi:hypothetical protein